MFVGESPVTGVARRDQTEPARERDDGGGAYYPCAIPLVWRAYWSTDYAEEGQVTLMQQLLVRLLPADQVAVVLADRGLGTSPRSSTRSAFIMRPAFVT